jgi:5-formyltetrahydrofolate cyclo-ligase
MEGITEEARKTLTLTLSLAGQGRGKFPLPAGGERIKVRGAKIMTNRKQELRDQMRKRLASLSPADMHAKSAAIRGQCFLLPEFAAADWVFAYVSRGHEVATRGLIEQLLVTGKHVCVPKYDEPTRQYVASELRDFDRELVKGKFGILEPSSEAVRRVGPGKLDALLVPGLAFDQKGNRLGRGLGFFDRILQKTTGVKLALAYDFQLVDEVPAEEHDVRMDFIITETRVVNVKRT